MALLVGIKLLVDLSPADEAEAENGFLVAEPRSSPDESMTKQLFTSPTLFIVGCRSNVSVIDESSIV